MTLISIRAAIAVTFAVSTAAVTGALAQQPPASDEGQTPPAQSQSPTVEPAKDEPKRVTDDSDFKQSGKANTFVIGLVNTCEKRFKCTVSAYVVTAGGPSTGRKVLVLGPKSQGASARQSYAFKVKGTGGTANISNKCTQL